MKRTTLAVSLSLLFATSAFAGDFDTLSSIMSKAQASNKGVIVAVTENGEVATSTASLVSNQAQQNTEFAPLMMVLKPAGRVGTLTLLGLQAAELPALIYFDKNGAEINRVVSVAPAVSNIR